MGTSTEAAYALARERYGALGVDTDEAIRVLLATPISLHCWQGDDVAGFEGDSVLSGGILATGNYMGRASGGDELRADLEQALKLLPGKNRVNLHAMYAETGGVRVERDQLEPAHFSRWIDWARAHTSGLDMNPTFFSHPKAASGFTLASRDEAVRTFWINHAIACRKIAAAMGRALGSPSVNNIWIPDGYKDMPADRAIHRSLLKDSLDRIMAEPISRKECLDAVEGKLFGLASESYVAGSQEFYLAYALSKNLLMCLDMGHFHPTEDVGDKISSLMLYLEGLLLHVSRGVRWDSDHVVVTDDPLNRLMSEIVRGGFLPRVKIATDFFDASINRIGAWAIGARATQKALLRALCEPAALLRKHEADGDFTGRLMLLEEAAMLPLGAVWEHVCLMSNVPTERGLLEEVQRHERIRAGAQGSGGAPGEPFARARGAPARVARGGREYAVRPGRRREHLRQVGGWNSHVHQGQRHAARRHGRAPRLGARGRRQGDADLRAAPPAHRAVVGARGRSPADAE